MSEHIEKTLSELQSKLAEQEEAVIQTKKLMNLLCEHSGKPPIFLDADLTVSGGKFVIQSDQFYGKKLITAAREILELRKAATLGPATPREIYDTLIEGGYKFETDNEANRLTGLRISLRKASAIFHRLPDGKRYGLLAWYKNVKKPKGNQENNTSTTENDIDQEENNDEE